MLAMQQQQIIPTPFPINQAPPQSLIQVRNYPTLYVGNLEEQITEEMLYKFFYNFGNIYSIRVMRDRQTKNSRGFAYVSFYQFKDAENARKQTNHEKILKKELRVTWKKNLHQEINKEANVFVKNLDEQVTSQDLEQEFSQFGSIFSCKVCVDQNNVSRGYGYVQFDKPEFAQKCIQEAGNLKIKEKVVTAQLFVQKKEREDSRKNLYFKNLPNQEQLPTNTKEEIKKLLDQICQNYGIIESSDVIQDKNNNRFFAFVSFKENTDADQCYQQLKDKDPFNLGEKLYINWHQNKSSRQKSLKQQYSDITNETNLFTKFLKPEVTLEELKEQFECYGVITSCNIKTPQPKGDYQIKTNYGFINFENKESAKKAIAESKNNQEIKNLFENGNIYLNYLIKKDQWNHCKDARQRYKKQNMPQLIYDPMLMNPLFMQGMQPFNPRNIPIRPPFMPGFQPLMPQFMQQQFNQPPHLQQQRPQNFAHPQQLNNFNKQQGQRVNQNQNRNYKNKNHQQGYNKQRKNQNGQQNAPAQTRQNIQPQQQQQQQQKKNIQYTSQNLKENLQSFLELSKDEQRTILGEFLFPQVQKFAKQIGQAPKITGMLIDFEVFEIQEIIEFLESEEHLKERVEEAEELINAQETN